MPKLDDEQFANYLRSFHPTAPEPLDLKSFLVKTARRSILAATTVGCLAVVALVVVLLSRNSQRALDFPSGSSPNEQTTMLPLDKTKRASVTTPVLTKLALDDRAAFDEFMTEKVRTQFPLMKSEQSSLRVLAKE